MTLYSYKKAPVKPIKQEQDKEEGRTSITIANILDNIIFKVSQKLSQIRPISLILPLIFIISGIAILYGQTKPYAVHFIQSKFSDRLDQEIIPLVPDTYEEIRSEYITDPGAKYFSDILTADEIDSEIINFKGTFYLTIDKIQINEAPVEANVDSTKEGIYKDALSKGLAHFKGSILPGKEGNVLIYGHSAAGDYAEKNPSDVVTAFTRLFKLNIGDEIKINFEDNEYNYIVKKIKEVNPEEVDVIANQGGKTLTLLTCSPPGLNSKRLVITAIQK